MSMDEKVKCVRRVHFDDWKRRNNIAANQYCPEVGATLATLMQDVVHVPRAECETDETFVQIIPYFVVVCGDYVLAYKRQGGGEARLDQRESIGFGGHLNDGDTSYLTGLSREGLEELRGFSLSAVSVACGVIVDQSTAVSRVHVGVLHVYDFQSAPVSPIEAKEHYWARGEHACMSESMETWSRLAAAMLLQIGECGEGVSDDPENVDCQ